LGERAVLETVALKKLACALEQAGGREFPLTHVDDPRTLQFYLNSWRPCVSDERAAELLRGAEPAFVAVNDWHQLQLARKPDDPPWFTLLPDAANSTNCPARIVANRPDFNLADHCAFCFGPVFVRVHGARLLSATEPELRFAASGSTGEIIIANESAAARKVRVCVIEYGRRLVQERVLAGNETWSIPLSAIGFNFLNHQPPPGPEVEPGVVDKGRFHGSPSPAKARAQASMAVPVSMRPTDWRSGGMTAQSAC
jgi:hypothetical protein